MQSSFSSTVLCSRLGSSKSRGPQQLDAVRFVHDLAFHDAEEPVHTILEDTKLNIDPETNDKVTNVMCNV